MALKKGTPIRVAWMDAAQSEAQSIHDELEQVRPAPTVTWGVFLGVRKDLGVRSLMVASAEVWTTDITMDGAPDVYGSAIAIPEGMVLTLHRVEIGRAVKAASVLEG